MSIPPAGPNILLIGLRGSGKSAIGARLASRLARPFIDLDQATLARLGAPNVAQAWKSHGQQAFRAAEADALRAAMRDSSGAVVALGGGTPTAPGVADHVRHESRHKRAVVVYLRCTPAELRRRLTGRLGADRPSITGKDPLAEMDEVFRFRDPLYRSLAFAVIEDLSEDESLARIERVLAPIVGKAGAPQGPS
ncbi:MAG: AAA family ATPase [Phycisphaerales bacterium]|nr:AAA family ATPase [Phycisphaerales bacterium]